MATNYYLSNDGNDNNTGKSLVKCWLTIERLNKQKLLPGDSVLFKRNQVFSGQIVVQYSGTVKRQIIYSSFGEGKAAVISGVLPVTNWQQFKEGIYSTPSSLHVYNVFVDGIMQVKARYPNSGWLRVDEGFGNGVTFKDGMLTQPNGFWEGATVRFRAWDWEFRSSTVNNFAAQTITIKDTSSNTFSAGWGYYFDNKMEVLDTLKEWYYSDAMQQLYYLPAHSDFNTHPVEVTVYTTGVTIAENVSYITITNLSIQKFETYGIWAKGNNSTIRISNCLFENINQTAIDFNEVSKNCSINNNTIKNINGRGISAKEPESMIISGNTISAIGKIPGYGINGVNGMIGIALENNEVIKDINSHTGSNNIISNNKIDSTGYVGIRMDGANSVMENNIVSNCLIELSDGAAIYCWAKSKFYTHDNIIRNNIVYNITGNNIGTPSESNPIANGIYIDNNCYNIAIDGNTVFNSTGSGIHINSDAYDNVVTKNTVYNCSAGISIAEWAKPNSTFGNSVENNIVFSTNQQQRCVSLSNWLMPTTSKLGWFNNNTYVNLKEKYIFSESYLTLDKSQKVLNEHSFESWQKTYGFDSNSIYLGHENQLNKFQKSEILINETGTEKNYDFTNKEYYQLDGSKITELKLLPFSSKLLIYK